jgi:hypothetical protein
LSFKNVLHLQVNKEKKSMYTRKYYLLPSTILVLFLWMTVIQAQVHPSGAVLYDPFNGSTVGTAVGNPLPEFMQGVFNQGIRPTRGSSGAAIRYNITPGASGTVSFWVRLVEDIKLYPGDNIGFYGRESTDRDCNDFFMQLQSDGGLTVGIFSRGPDGLSFSASFGIPSWKVCEVHHIAVTWGNGQQPRIYLDGVQQSIKNAPALPYIPKCPNSPPFLFAASRVRLQASYKPGPFVFDELLIYESPLSEDKIQCIFKGNC